MTGSDKKAYSLQDFVGKQAVIIAWFPRAFTKGCTAECKSMKESGEMLKGFDVAYFTASTDPVEKNADFAASLMLDYPILCDLNSRTPGRLAYFERMEQRRIGLRSSSAKMAISLSMTK